MTSAGDAQTVSDLEKVAEIIEQRMYELGEDHRNYNNLKDILDVVRGKMPQMG